MWGRKNVATELKRLQQQQGRRKILEVSNEGKECRRSLAVQVSPEHFIPRGAGLSSADESPHSDAPYRFELENVESKLCGVAGGGDGGRSGKSTGEERTTDCIGEAWGGRGGVSRKMWRWRSSRRLQHKSTTILDANVNNTAVDERGSGKAGSESRSYSPSRLSLRRRGKGTSAANTSVATMATATPAGTTVTLSSGGSCLTPRTSRHPHRPGSADHLANSTSPDLIAIGDSSTATTAAAAAAAAASVASLVFSSLDDRKPECVVASILLNNGGGADSGVLEPVSPSISIASEGGATPGWAERAGLSGGVAVADASRTVAGRASTTSKRSPLFKECPVADDHLSAANLMMTVKNNGDREVPRFLRPVIVLLTLSLLAIGGATLLRAGRRWAGGERWTDGGVVLFGPAAYAAGGVQLQEAVLDDIFERADKDQNGVIGDEEIQFLVELAGGSRLDDASEIEAGVASVIKNLDKNADQTLSRSDLNTYWDRLGSLLTVEEAAQWVLHAAQLPQEVADAFVNNMVTGYDFPELWANQGALLEQDLRVTRPAFKRNLVRSMQWKLWGMGEEPAPPTGLRAANASCGALSLDWEQAPANRELSFPVHKYVLRRALLGPEGERNGGWVTVMAEPSVAFFDAGLRPGAAYRYALQGWNALGHSSSVEVNVVVAKEGCALGSSWFWSPVGGDGPGRAGFAGASFSLLVAAAVSTATVFCFRTLGSRGGSDDCDSDGGKKRPTHGSSSSPRSREGARENGGSSSSGSSWREAELNRGTKVPHAVTGTAAKTVAAATMVLDGDRNGDRVAGGSPTSSKSIGGEWSDRDREKIEPRRRLSGSGDRRPSPTSSRLPKERLRRTSSDVTATGGKSAGISGGLGRSPGAGLSNKTIGDSVRKQRAMRLARHPSSRDEKEVCKECGREWRWYRLVQHTCCVCHLQFCDRRECGSASHSFGACPVGGSCTCSSCFEAGRLRPSSSGDTYK